MKRNGVGTASFVLIVFVLAMACFSLLGYYQAISQHKMSERSIRYVQKYYAVLGSLHEQIAALNEENTIKEEQIFSKEIEHEQYLIIKTKVVNNQYEIVDTYVLNQQDWQEQSGLELWNGE
ncbi:hypothetical protein C815_00852 [Firmicutes bacterium M10-2]|nr:hypothetical protein C815_00852 [Firmicutes bacterium M10-2]